MEGKITMQSQANLFLLTVLLVRSANGSDCKFCDEHNIIGFHYTMECSQEFDQHSEDHHKCLISCGTTCKCTNHYDTEELTARIILNCEAHCSAVCIIIWILLILLILGCIIGLIIYFWRRHQRIRREQMLTDTETIWTVTVPPTPSTQRSTLTMETGKSVLI